MRRWMMAVVAAAAMMVLSGAVASAEEYRPEVRELFLQGCMDEGDRAACTCILNAMEKQISEEQLLNGDVPDDVLDVIIHACINAAD